MPSLLRRVVCVGVIAACASVALPREGASQGLGIALFERYLDALRRDVGIPGLAAAIVQDGTVVWERGFGVSDVGRAVPVRPDTPFPIGGLTQSLTATVLMQCMERGLFVLDDRMQRWTSALPEPDATVLRVMAHVSDASRGSTFHYDPARYATLTEVADWCERQPYSRTLADWVFDRLGMADSVPGAALGADARSWFDAATLARYEAVLAGVARPYRSGQRQTPEPGVYAPEVLDAAGGAVSTVRDLARWDAALGDQVLVDRTKLDRAWRPVVVEGSTMPTGLGWFVQREGGLRLVWQFGEVPGAYSSLLLKVPARGVTLILLANSDGLSAPFNLQDGDVTRSVFARLFLRLTA